MRAQVLSVRRIGRTVRSVGSPCYELEEEREDSKECGGAKVMSVRRTERTLRSLGSPDYECEEDREYSEECGEPRL